MNYWKELFVLLISLATGWSCMGDNPVESEFSAWKFSSQNLTPDWSVRGVSSHDFSPDGIFLVSGQDSQIISTGINFPAEKVAAIEIVLSTDRASVGQVFFSTSTNPMSEKSSYRFPVKGDGAWQTVRIECDANPLWKGTITGLRLDPVDNVQGIKVTVKSLRLFSPVSWQQEKSWSFGSMLGMGGWTAYGVSKQELTSEGLNLLSALDCRLTANKTRFAAEKVSAVEIVMRSNRDDWGQIYFQTDTVGMSEKSSCRFKVYEGREFRTYRIDCSKNQLWKGDITGLRIDPVEQSGVEVEIKTIRLIEQHSLSFKSGPWDIRIDGEKGYWQELKYNGRLLMSNPAGMPCVDFCVAAEKGRKWLSEDPNYRLIENQYNAAEKTLKLTWANQDWRVTETIRFSPNGQERRIERNADFVLLAKTPQKFHQFNFYAHLPLQGKYFFPGTFFLDNMVAREQTRVKNTGLQGELQRMGLIAELPYREVSGDYSVKTMLTELSQDWSQIFFVDTRLDSGFLSVTRMNRSLRINNVFWTAGWADPGEPQHLGSAWLEVSDLSAEKALAESFPRLLKDLKLGVPDDRPDWVKDAAIFSYQVHRFQKQSIRSKITSLIPRIRELGFNTVWCLSVQPGTEECAPTDFYQVAPAVGGWDDWDAMVKSLHKQDIRILQCMFPHGTDARAGMVRGNSIDQMVFTESGNVLMYWAFDFNNPDWQKYMGEAAGFYSRHGADGIRLDAPFGSIINNWRRKGFPSELPGVCSRFDQNKSYYKVDQEWWEKCLSKNGGIMPALPYQRASLTQSCGGLNMCRAVRDSIREVSPNNVLMPEIGGMPLCSIGDIMFDMAFPNLVYKLITLQPERFSPLLSLWLEEQKLVESPDTVRMRYLCLDFDLLKGQLWTGFDAACALTSLSFMIHGVPMIYDPNDQGYGVHIRRLNEVRNSVAEFRRGEAFYTTVKPSAPEVFAVLRQLPERSALGLINFSPRPVEMTLTLPMNQLGFQPEAKLDLWNAYSGSKLGTGTISEFKQLKLNFSPWETVALVWLPANTVPSWKNQASAPATVALTSDKPRLHGDMVTCAAYSLTFDRNNGMIISWRDRQNHELIKNSDLLLTPANDQRRQVIFNAKSKSDGVEVTVEYRLQSENVITLNYYCRPDKIMVSVDSRKMPAMLTFPLPSGRQYQIDTVEGMLADWINPAQIAARDGVRLHLHRVENLTDGALLWDSRIQPLNPNRPELRTWEQNQGGVTVRILPPNNTPWPSCRLIDYLAGQTGLHYVVTANPVASIELLPTAAPLSAATATYRMGDLTVTNESHSWRIENSHYILQLRKNGGVIAGLTDKATGRKLLTNQDLFGEQGFDPDKGYVAASADLNTRVTAWWDGSRFRIGFKSEMRSAKTKTYDAAAAPSSLSSQIEYACDSSPVIGMLSGIRNASGYAASPLLDWRAQAATGMTVHNNNQGGVNLLDSNGARKLQITATNNNGPIKIDNANITPDGFRFCWFNGKNGPMRPGIWHQLRLDLTVASSDPAKSQSIDWLPDSREFNDDRAFALRTSAYSVSRSHIIPYYSNDLPDMLWWAARRDSFPYYGMGKDGKTAWHFGSHGYNFYIQSLSPTELPPGQYQLSFRLKSNVTTKSDIRVVVEWADNQGGRHVKDEIYTFTASADWQEKSLIFKLDQPGYAPLLRVISDIKNGSILLDGVNFMPVKQ